MASPGSPQRGWQALFPGFCGLGIVLLSGMQGTRADTAVFVAVADAELREASPLAPYGTGATMVSGGLGDNVDNTRRRALFKFDLGDRIPPGSVIQSVSVTVDVVLRLPVAAANSDFGLHRLLRSWRETAVTWTWANNPIAPWGQPGASSATDAAALPSAKVAVSALGQYTFDSTGELVADVQDWLDRPNSNAGWLLRSETEAPFTARHFASRESSTGGATLTVDYEPPPLLEPVTIGAVTVQNAQLRFTFEGRGGTAYRVEFREDLASGDWQTITNIPAQAVSGLIAVLHPIQGMTGYYRIETVPTRSMESDRYHSRPGLPQVTLMESRGHSP